MRVQCLAGVFVLVLGLALAAPGAAEPRVEIALLGGPAVSNMGSGFGVPVTLRAHALVEPGVSYGLEGGYVGWGEKHEVCATAQVGPCEDGLRETLGFLAVSGKWRGRGDRAHTFFSFGGGVYRRSRTLADGRDQRFGGGFDVAFGYERVAAIAPAAEITLRISGADRDLLTMIGVSVGLNFNPRL